MSANETVVAGVLAAHHCHVGPVSGRWVCACGATSTNGSIERGDLTSPAERCAEYHAHAAAALAPLLQQAREEGGAIGWEVGYLRGARDTECDMERADNPCTTEEQR